MELVDIQLKNVLNGGGISEDNLYCDFTLANQNEAIGSYSIIYIITNLLYELINGY